MEATKLARMVQLGMSDAEIREEQRRVLTEENRKAIIAAAVEIVDVDALFITWIEGKDREAVGRFRKALNTLHEAVQRARVMGEIR